MPRDIPIKPGGDSPEARFLKAVWEAIWGSGRLVEGAGVTISPGTKGRVISAEVAVPQIQKTSPSVTFGRFAFLQGFSHYVVGQNLDTQEVVGIGKPPELFSDIKTEVEDGVTWNINNADGTPGANAGPRYLSRTKSGNTSSGNVIEFQRIIPYYMAKPFANGQASVIFAVKMPFQVATVQAGDGLSTVPTGSPIFWQDLNVAGRAWAAKFDQSSQ